MALQVTNLGLSCRVVCCVFVKKIPWLQLSFVLEVIVIKTLQA